MKKWIKNLFKEMVDETRDSPRTIRANRRPTSSDHDHPLGTTWENQGHVVYVLSRKSAKWIKDKDLSKEAKERSERNFYKGELKLNQIKKADDPCSK